MSLVWVQIFISFDGAGFVNYALITIDTEAHTGDRPVDRFIWGETSDGLHGIDELMDLFESFGTKAIFFLDFAECWDYGDDAIESVAKAIVDRGHTVGVHVHPDHLLDKSRHFLWEYSDEEQRFIIESVTKKYEDLLDCSPEYFRAGKYSANRTTLKLLIEYGYKYDFSEFYGNPWCGIKPPITGDSTFYYGDLLEVPVTSFKSIAIAGFEHYNKIDMDMPGTMLRYVSNRFCRQNDHQVLTLFGHSFSLVGNRRSEDMRDLSYSQKNASRFKKALAHIDELDTIRLVSPDEFEALIVSGVFDDNMPNDTPSVSIDNPLVALFFAYMTSWDIKSFNRKAQILLAGSGVVLAAGIAALLYAFFSRFSFRI